MESKSGGGSSGGRGMDAGKGMTQISFVRGSEDTLIPPTQEESLKTIFVGGIPRDFDDEWMERILKVGAYELPFGTIIGLIHNKQTGSSETTTVGKSNG